MCLVSFENRTSSTRSSSGNGTGIGVSLHKETILKGMLPKLKSGTYIVVYRSSGNFLIHPCNKFSANTFALNTIVIIYYTGEKLTQLHILTNCQQVYSFLKLVSHTTGMITTVNSP